MCFYLILLNLNVNIGWLKLHMPCINKSAADWWGIIFWRVYVAEILPQNCLKQIHNTKNDLYNQAHHCVVWIEDDDALMSLLQVMPRLRVGIGRPVGQMSVERHVLSRFSSEERKVLDSVLAQSVDILLSQFLQQESQSPSSPAGGRQAAQKRKEREISDPPVKDSAAAQTWSSKFINVNKENRIHYREGNFIVTVFILWLELNEVTNISTEHDNSSKRRSQEQSNHKTGLKFKSDEWHDLQSCSLFCVYLFIKDDFTLSNVWSFRLLTEAMSEAEQQAIHVWCRASNLLKISNLARWHFWNIEQFSDHNWTWMGETIISGSLIPLLSFTVYFEAHTNAEWRFLYFYYINNDNNHKLRRLCRLDGGLQWNPTDTALLGWYQYQ